MERKERKVNKEIKKGLGSDGFGGVGFVKMGWEQQGLSELLKLFEFGLDRNLTEDAIVRAYTSIIFAGVDLIANTVASTPFKLYRNGEELKGKQLENDFYYKLLNSPNPYMSFFDFVYALVVMQVLFGERYVYIEKAKRGKVEVPKHLWVIPSHWIEPEFDRGGLRVVGFTYYWHNSQGEFKPVELSPDEVVFDIVPSPLEINRGEGLIPKLALEWDIHYFAKEFVKTFYKNGTVPIGILATEERLTKQEIDLITEEWKRKFEGGSKGFRVPVLSGGLKFQPISAIPKADEIVKQAEWTRNDILAILKVPPALLGFTEGVNRTTAREQTLTFLRDNIKPKLQKLEFFFNHKLFPLIGAKNYQIKFQTPVPQDEELNVQKAKVGATFGVLTINEIRRLLGFEPLDEEGEELVAPLNMPQGREKEKTESEKGVEVEDIDRQINGYLWKVLEEIEGRGGV